LKQNPGLEDFTFPTMSESEGPEHKTKRLLQELAIFGDVARALTSDLSLDSVLQSIINRIAEFFRPDNCSLMMVDEEKDELYSVIAAGNTAEILKSARLKVGEGIAGWVAKHGEPIIVPDVYTDPRSAQRI
jgi:GAF domain-containing protein